MKLNFYMSNTLSLTVNFRITEPSLMIIEKDRRNYSRLMILKIIQSNLWLLLLALTCVEAEYKIQVEQSCIFPLPDLSHSCTGLSRR